GNWGHFEHHRKDNRVPQVRNYAESRFEDDGGIDSLCYSRGSGFGGKRAATRSEYAGRENSVPREHATGMTAGCAVWTTPSHAVPISYGIVNSAASRSALNAI